MYISGADASLGWVEGCNEPTAVPTPSVGSFHENNFLGNSIMSNMPDVAPVPEFERLSRSAIECAVELGVAKVNNVLFPASAAALCARNVTDIELVLHIAPELGEFVHLFDIGKARSIGRYLIQYIYRPAIGVFLDPHTDNSVVSCGVDLLLPLSGPEGNFVAAENEWSPSDGESPEYMTTYGVGSGILLRQHIVTMQGLPVNKSYTWHTGWSNGDRQLLSVCYANRHITFASGEEAAGLGQ